MSNPLLLHHEKMGAIFDLGSVPAQYTNVNEEYWAVKKNAGFSDISHLGRLTITGKDRSSWLNGLVTNDLSRLKENKGVHSVLLNTRARVIADLYICSMGDRFVVDTGNALSGKIRQYLEGFIVSEQVQIRDSTDELTQLTIQGPAAANAIQESLGINVRDMKALDVLQLGPSLMIARDRTGTSGYDIILPKDESESVWQGLLLKTGEVGAQPVGSKALEILRVEAGIPKYGVDVDENNIVLEAGYRDAINYSKGCYLGQEVVARATHIGRVNKQLAKLNIETQATIPSGTKLYSTDREAGYVTSSAYSLSRETTVGLGYVNRDYTKEGTSLQVIANGINYPVTVLSVV